MTLSGADWEQRWVFDSLQFEVQHTASQQRRIPGSTLLAGAEPSPSLLMLQLNQSQAALG